MIEGPEESVRGEASSSGAAGGGHAEGGADVSQGSDGVQEMGGPSGENGGSGNDEGVGLRLFEWEPKVFSLTSSRPTAELSGFEYVDKSEVSGGGCGKETCALASRAGGEIGACHCPVPLGEEFPFNRVCQCDEQIRGPNGECQFSLRDEELLSQKKLLVLGEGVVAGELMPKGTLTAVCKGKVRSTSLAAPYCIVPSSSIHHFSFFCLLLKSLTNFGFG